MKFSCVLLFVAAGLCCASALQEILFPGLRALTKNGGKAALTRRNLNIRMTDEQKCDKLMGAMRRLIRAVERAGDDDVMINSFRDSILQSTGIDINDDDHLRESVCAVAQINTIADLASVSGLSEDMMRMYYSSFVDSINTIRSTMSSLSNSSYMSRSQRKVIKAAVKFYDVYEEIGLLSLN